MIGKHGIDLARRPTGGGIVFHIWDLAFSFLMPSNHPKFSLNTMENYRFVNDIVSKAVTEYFSISPTLAKTHAPSLGNDCQHFCMAKPTQYDVMVQGQKIAGSAQRKKGQGYLHQGTISLMRPDFHLLQEVLLSKEAVLSAMQTFTCCQTLEKNLEQTRKELEILLADKLKIALTS